MGNPDVLDIFPLHVALLDQHQSVMHVYKAEEEYNTKAIAQ